MISEEVKFLCSPGILSVMILPKKNEFNSRAQNFGLFIQKSDENNIKL